MTKFFRVSFLAAAICSMSLITSCSDDPALPDNATEFQSSELGFTSVEPELVVTITLSRAAESDGVITVGINPTGVAYDTDFTTDPAAVSKAAIVLNVPAGATQASFKIVKKDAASFDGDETISFRINYTDGGLTVGQKNELTVKFGEIVAVKADMKINGGGVTYPNRVFIDLSANRQTSAVRTSWDLAFSSTADEFRVYLNSANGMLARPLNKTDLTTVTAADTTGFSAQLDIDAIFGVVATTESNNYPAWLSQASSWTDTPTNLNATAIAAISPTESENKVYIVNRGRDTSGKHMGWKKIQIVRSGSNYVLRHADIASTTFTSTTVTKNAATDRTYVSFQNGVVTVEPAKAAWDFAWTSFTNIIPSGGPGAPLIPYFYQDFILSNTGNAEVAVYNTNATTTKTFDTFAEADLAGITFLTSQTTIGSGWRTTGGPPPAPAAGITANRFYLVKDADGNIYKVQFTALVDEGGLRGTPAFKFALVKKGA